METLLAKVGADTAFGLLVVAGLAHVRRLGGFRDLVRSQAIWPRQLVMPVVVTITTVELTIGLFGARLQCDALVRDGPSATQGHIARREPPLPWVRGVWDPPD